MNIGVLRAQRRMVRLHEQPMPAAPSGTQLLVRMLSAPVNPADLLAIDGDYAFQLGQDEVLGAEGVGKVEAVGAAVEAVAAGDIVLPLSRGNWSRYRLLEADDVVRVPPGLDPWQAAMLRINPATALHLLDDAALEPGDWLIQNAASSSVGRWVRTFAREAGINVINVVRHPPASALPNQIEDGADLPARVSEMARGGRVAAALDCVAGAATGRLAAGLAPGGRIIVFGHLSGAPCEVRSQLLTGKSLTISGFSLRPTEARIGRSGCARAFERIFAAAADAASHQPIRRIVPITQVDEAITAARASGTGRVLLDIAV